MNDFMFPGMTSLEQFHQFCKDFDEAVGHVCNKYGLQMTARNMEEQMFDGVRKVHLIIEKPKKP